MDLSILIVNWNTRDLLADCLASIAANAPTYSYEIIVVDNASADNSPTMVKERFPSVILIENSANPGFAQANNQAIARSRGRYVLLLNPDTVVLPGALDTLVDFMDRHPKAGAAGSRLFAADGSLQISCYPFPTLFRELWRLFHLDAVHPLAVYDMNNWSLDAPREIEAIQGSCFLLRRETLDQVGLLDGEFFMYSEEVDLCLRVRRGGWSLYWVPQARVIHYGGQSSKLVADEMFLQLYRGKVQYFRKHARPIVVGLYKLVLLAAASARIVVSPFAWLERPTQRRHHLAVAGQYQKLIYELRSF
jgi:GT2 family glycosyltransferase